VAFQKRLWRSLGLVSLLAASSVATMAQQTAATVTKQTLVTAGKPPPAADASEPAAGAVAGQPPSWSVGCSANERTAALNCAVEQRAFVANTGQLVGSVSVRVPGDKTGPVMTITTPLGLFLPAGVSVAIDDAAAQTLQVQTCDAHGCYAELAVSDDLLSRMFNGKKLNVGFQDMSRQPINLALSLAGFTPAYARIK
jgi:invasion protein IalB